MKTIYLISYDTYNKSMYSYILVRKTGEINEIVLSKQYRIRNGEDVNKFNIYINKLAKQFNATIVRDSDN